MGQYRTYVGPLDAIDVGNRIEDLVLRLRYKPNDCFVLDWSDVDSHNNLSPDLKGRPETVITTLEHYKTLIRGNKNDR